MQERRTKHCDESIVRPVVRGSPSAPRAANSRRRVSWIATLTCAVLGVQLAVVDPVEAQAGELRGVVTELASGAPLGGTQILLVRDGVVVKSLLTDRLGRYRIDALALSPHDVAVSRPGYQGQRRTGLTPSIEGRSVDFALVPRPYTLDPIVVSVSVAHESRLEAPASTSVIRGEDVRETQSATAVELIRYMPGVDFAAKGIATNTFSTRGPRDVTAASMLMLSDYRDAAVPYLGINTAQLLPSTSEDIERIEVVRGPGAVLYGPNSRRGVLHVVKRSPLEDAERVVSLGLGERRYVDAAFRVSQPFGDNSGIKLSGRYLRARDWVHVDSVELRLRQQAISAGAQADTLRIGKREEELESLQADARYDWRPEPRTLASVTVGLTRATGIETGAEAGAAQALDWVYGYAQVRLEHRSVFANLSYNWSDAGNTYNLRNGVTLTNDSRMVAMQVKNESLVGPSELSYGSDVRWTIPRTEGTLNGRFEDGDAVVETGVYAYATTPLSSRLDMVAAVRADHHNRLERSWFLSPRAGLVAKPFATHAVRLTYSRTFEQPAARLMFADFSLGPLGPLPYNIQLFGLGGSRLDVLRDCAGPCMRVPEAFGSGSALRPAEATLMWPAVVGLLAAQGIDLSAIPAPSASRVGTRFGALNFTTGGFDALTPDRIADTPPIRRIEEQVFELGYKALLSDDLFVGIDLYHTKARHVFASGSAVLTPNVFFDASSLTEYLSAYMPAPAASSLATGIAQIPIGTIATRQSPNSDILVAPFGDQGGAYSFWGLDLAVDARMGTRFSAHVGYSWVSRDSAALGVRDAFLLFNIPRNKASLALEYRDVGRGVSLAVRGRTLGSFSVNSPAYIGVVDAYSAIDAGIGYDVPWADGLRVSVDAANLLGDPHREFIGSAEIGRLVLLKLRAEL
jgi:outer membrane receptor protein involved in Fe transport